MHVLKKKKTTADDSESILSQKVSNNLRLAKNFLLAQHLVELAGYFLSVVQQDELAAFYSEGRLNKKKEENSNIKKAIRALYALDELLRISEIEEEKLDKALERLDHSLGVRKSVESEDEHLMRYGLNVWFGSDLFAKQLKKTLKENDTNDEKKATVRTLINELLVRVDEIADFIGYLFDYPREVQLAFDKTFPVTGSQKESTFDDSQI